MVDGPHYTRTPTELKADPEIEEAIFGTTNMLLSEMLFCTEFASKHPYSIERVSCGYVSNEKKKMVKVVRIFFNKNIASYENLLRFYFSI